MSYSSGDMEELSPVNTTGTYLTTDIALSTSYEPRTQAYMGNGSDVTDVYLIPRGQSSHTTLKFHGKPRYFEATATTKTTTQTADDTNIIITVGITCGILGIVMGIIIAAAFWSFKKRQGNHKEQRYTMEKNPKEKTFEPLDLSLTLPKYEPSLHSMQRQHNSLAFQSGNFTAKDQRQYRYKDMHHSFKIPSSSSPVIHNSTSSPYRSNAQFSHHRSIHQPHYHISRKSWDQTASLDSRVLRHTTTHNYGPNDLESAQIPSSISTRESFSSGLGTCTESEICSFESRSQPTTSDSEQKTKRSIDMVSERVGDDYIFPDTIGEYNNAHTTHLEKRKYKPAKINPIQSSASSQIGIDDSASSELSMSPTSPLAYKYQVANTFSSSFKQNQIGEDFLQRPLELNNQISDAGQQYESPTTICNSSELHREKSAESEENRENKITIVRRNSDVTIDL